MLIGYARISTYDQTLSPQKDALEKAGCEKIFTDRVSGTKAARKGLEEAFSHLRRGDTLVVTRIDRLARSIKDLQDIVYLLKARGVTLRATEQPINTQSAAGKAFLDMLVLVQP